MTSSSAHLQKAEGHPKIVEAIQRKTFDFKDRLFNRMDRLLGFSVPKARRSRLHEALGLEQLESRLLLSATSGLWLSTDSDVSSSGAPGLNSWSAGEAIQFSDPGLAFNPGITSGTFSSVFNLDNFAADNNVDIDALHYVTSDITIGSSTTIDLFAGDVLFSTVA